jgi:ubiquinone/menaquinone biosynthesis C-methylase UbiE
VLDLDGRVVCDIGAGAGRFTLLAAACAQTVIAVDAVPALLERLRRNAAVAGRRNVDVRRGSFAALPLDDASVDVAVACSSFRSQAPHGGRRALAEAERVVRPGGEVAVIWPQERAWFRRHGFTYIALHSDDVVRFRDVATAERLCAAYYSAAAATWVRRHNTAEVPYRVLGTSPPSSVCVKRVS